MTSCSASQLYLAPTAGQSYDAVSPLTIRWDPKCFTSNPDTITIYLYANSVSPPLLPPAWQVPTAQASYSATLQPKWWNNAAAVNLTVALLPAGQTILSGGVTRSQPFVVTYNSTEYAASSSAAAAAASSRAAAEGGSVSSDGTYVPPGNNGSHLAKGQIAAAVLCSLLGAGIVALFFVWRTRRKGQNKRKRWSQHLDQRRMSRVSNNTGSIYIPAHSTPDLASPAAAEQAPEWRPRASMVSTGNRSSFFGGNKDPARPLSGVSGWSGGAYGTAADPRKSTVSTTNQAGVGARRMRSQLPPQDRGVSFFEADKPRRDSEMYNIPKQAGSAPDVTAAAAAAAAQPSPVRSEFNLPPAAARATSGYEPSSSHRAPQSAGLLSATPRDPNRISFVGDGLRPDSNYVSSPNASRKNSPVLGNMDLPPSPRLGMAASPTSSAFNQRLSPRQQTTFSTSSVYATENMAAIQEAMQARAADTSSTSNPFSDSHGPAVDTYDADSHLRQGAISPDDAMRAYAQRQQVKPAQFTTEPFAGMRRGPNL